MQNPKKLDVYNKAYDFSRRIYEITKTMSNADLRLKNQLFGSVTAIPANLMEFASMESSSQMAQKLRVCIGEANESEYWLDFIKDSGIIDEKQHKELLNELKTIRMSLFNLLKKIKNKR